MLPCVLRFCTHYTSLLRARRGVRALLDFVLARPALTQFYEFRNFAAVTHLLCPQVHFFAALSILLRRRLCFPAARDSSSHRLFITAFMLASKTIRDQGMFALREINHEEREMCSPRVAAERRPCPAARL